MSKEKTLDHMGKPGTHGLRARFLRTACRNPPKTP